MVLLSRRKLYKVKTVLVSIMDLLTLLASGNIDAEFLDDCILDVCAGGEEAAELAGDILSE